VHELGITQEVVALAEQAAAGRRVTRVVFEIGKLSGVLPDAVRFCFELCAEGTSVAGAVLEIVEPPGKARCRACGGGVELARPLGQCGCGSRELDWVSGDELRVREVEVV
jgi:hydrogenase nickel incorporation protein HypA/HybF